MASHFSSFSLAKNMTVYGAVGLLKQVENNLLKEKIRNMETSEATLKAYYENEIGELKRIADLNIEMYNIEKLNNQISREREQNSDIVLSFIIKNVENIELETKALKNIIEEQKLLLKSKEDENANLQNIVLSLEKLVKEEEERKKRLTRIVLNERKVCQSYDVISKFDVKTPDYLTFINDMGKTLIEQQSLIEDLR